MEDINNSEIWILKYELSGEKEKTARILSRLNKDIITKYNPTILSNGYSAYFNRSLYPIVNEFERKLRKLLYLASSLSENEEYKSKVKDLEKKDLGEIFTMLFVDKNFVNNVKARVNGQKGDSGVFTQKEIIEEINNIQEKSLWDQLLGENYVRTLRNNFNEIKDFRNDVMHAHNIDVECFKKAKQIFKKSNEELDSAIGELLGAKENNLLTSVVAKDFNKILGTALRSMKSQINMPAITETLNGMYSQELQEKIQLISQVLSEQFSYSGKLSLGKYALKPEVTDALSNMGKLAALQADVMPTMQVLQSLVQQLNQYKISIPPMITEFQQKLSDIDVSSMIDDSEEDKENDENGEDEKSK